MNRMNIRELRKNESIPMQLLLLADPSSSIVEDYLVRGKCFVAEIENEIVGEYVLLPTKSETIELVNVAVSRNRQGKGIGKKLVQDAVEQAVQRGYKIIEVGTGNSSLDQLALYQKCGFRITGVDSEFLIRHYPEEIFENGIQCRDMVRLTQHL